MNLNFLYFSRISIPSTQNIPSFFGVLALDIFWKMLADTHWCISILALQSNPFLSFFSSALFNGSLQPFCTISSNLWKPRIAFIFTHQSLYNIFHQKIGRLPDTIPPVAMKHKHATMLRTSGVYYLFFLSPSRNRAFDTKC